MSFNQDQLLTSSNEKTNSSQSKLEAVANFISQYEAPQLREISEQQTSGFLKRFFGKRLRYNLLSQDVEMDGISLRRHETETLKVEDRIQVICQEEYQCVFKKQKTYRNSLLDMIGNNHYHPVKEYLEGLQASSITPANIDDLAERYLGNSNELSNLLLKKTRRSFQSFTSKSRKGIGVVKTSDRYGM